MATDATLQPIAGIHSARAALKFGAAGVGELWLDPARRDQRLADLAELAHRGGVSVRGVERDELERAARGANHQGVVIWVRVPAAGTEHDLERILDALTEPPLLLLLDGVQDPHNLGACLRTADGAGVQALIAPKDNAVGLTPTVCKVASGAAATLPYLQVTNLARTMDRLKARGIWLVGTAATATTELYDLDLTGPLGLVMGSEGSGLRRLVQERCDHLVRLPLHGRVESLNVSVATGIALYEALRQRRVPAP
ncbi:23S rRNA (guanosine(2251)-2'-O)-methyltransferase RlmB [Thiocapsa imhoffii]|uniref:23S rRNA (guanosine-2'-O-)-methyltransferase RlmB n=1 Tax=Thiocapsa imhoffii TaxID=382777 RepID=A0A9X0WHC2_9GAMM|nr:23S rRNA (guanosine(2251)-2'-O)-methyltransferase RlmB [Thiocapsa imhoffii]MBK1644563.1 23S rRNA (guanosine(2251)-2'-O)-methyltransferase RlmB [Thiocapsa imhoffii]